MFMLREEMGVWGGGSLVRLLQGNADRREWRPEVHSGDRRDDCRPLRF